MSALRARGAERVAPPPPPVVTASGSPIPVRISVPTNAHDTQVAAGFQRLEDAGVVRCAWREPAASPLGMEVDTPEVRLYYDMHDGLNWLRADRATNLTWFAEHAPAGVLFKRSFEPELRELAPARCRVEPYGLNLQVDPPRRLPGAGPRGRRAAERLRRSSMLRRMVGAPSPRLPEEELVGMPQLTGTHRILFYTRLWDPDDPAVTWDDAREERVEMNRRRQEALRACRDHLGPQFDGGLVADAYSSRRADPTLLLSRAQTERHRFLAAVKQHAICVSTAGLHRSTGWRFAEYVAGARAIVCEPLHFDPGPGVVEGENYLSFADTDGLVTTLEALLADPERVGAMMEANRRSYRLHCSPEAIIHRSLATALSPDR